jgi:LPS sulfotransferase NodH
MAKKFIIITTARSGSQMLCEFLTKQENIACEYELLQSHREAKHKKGRLQSSSQFEEILGKDPSKFVGNRNRNFIEFLKIWEGMFSSEYFGFKVFFKSHLGTHKLSPKDAISYEDFAKYIKDYDIKIIHLTRNNILLKYISYKTSKITGVTSSSRGLEINSIGIDVIYREFNEWRSNLLKEEQSVVDFLNDNVINYHHITYENLIGEDYVNYYKDIISFIGGNPDLFVDIRKQGVQTKKKTNIHSLRFKVSNLDDLIEEATLANDLELLDTINIELSKD